MGVRILLSAKDPYRQTRKVAGHEVPQNYFAGLKQYRAENYRGDACRLHQSTFVSLPLTSDAFGNGQS
jgi:hypothetical protein